MKKRVLWSSLIMAASLLSFNATATTVSYYFDGVNDCKGYFGDSFDACQIFVNADGLDVKLSPVIAKYDVADDGTVEAYETNGTDFPSITGNEFDFDAAAGTWSYVPDDADDPGVRYWAAKGGNGFNLFWEVDNATTELGGVCYGTDIFTLACLNEAMVVSAGDFAPPDGTNLSHITFYDSDSPVIIPLPASVWLMGAGLIGLAGIARRGK